MCQQPSSPLSRTLKDDDTQSPCPKCPCLGLSLAPPPSAQAAAVLSILQGIGELFFFFFFFYKTSLATQSHSCPRTGASRSPFFKSLSSSERSRCVELQVSRRGRVKRDLSCLSQSVQLNTD